MALIAGVGDRRRRPRIVGRRPHGRAVATVERSPVRARLVAGRTVSAPGVRFVVLLLAAVLGTAPAVAQVKPLEHDDRVYFECPCSLKSDGTTMTVTFGARSFRDSDSESISIKMFTVDRREEVGSVHTGQSLEAGGTLDTASYESNLRLHRGDVQIGLDLYSGRPDDAFPGLAVDDTVIMDEKVDLSQPFEIEAFDFLEDTDDDGVADANERIAGTDPEDPASTPGESVVDVVVFYSQGFLDRYEGDPRARIRHLVSHANTVLQDSDVSLEYRLVGMVQFLDDDAQYRLDTMRSEAERHGGDLRLILDVQDPQKYNCGYASINILRFVHGYLYQTAGHATMQDDCPSVVVSHELGHLLGLQHSFAQNEAGNSWRWARGHGVEGDFHTLMSYGSDDSDDAEELEVFSDPGATCRGLLETDHPCGVDRDEAEGADSRAAIEGTRFQIARLREGYEDRDDDGVVDPGDGFPDDPNEWRWDTDGDGELDVFDDDDDDDGVADEDDAFPLDGDEWVDTDGDGDGDNGDPDADNDAVADTVDLLPLYVTRAERMVLLVPPASDARREGLVRVVNLSPDRGRGAHRRGRRRRGTRCVDARHRRGRHPALQLDRPGAGQPGQGPVGRRRRRAGATGAWSSRASSTSRWRPTSVPRTAS